MTRMTSRRLGHGLLAAVLASAAWLTLSAPVPDTSVQPAPAAASAGIAVRAADPTVIGVRRIGTSVAGRPWT